MRGLPNVDVIIVTSSDEEGDITEAIQAGAMGYVMKSGDISTLMQRIRQVLSGRTGMADYLKAKLFTGLARRNQKSLHASLMEQMSLTGREMGVLTLVTRGATNNEIVAPLRILDNTVRAHIRNIVQKPRLENRTRLAVYGVHEGYTINRIA